MEQVIIDLLQWVVIAGLLWLYYMQGKGSK